MRGFWGLRSLVVVVLACALVLSGALSSPPPASAAGGDPVRCTTEVPDFRPPCVPLDSGTIPTSGTVTLGTPVPVWDYGNGTYDWEYPVYPRTQNYPSCAYGFNGYLYDVPCVEVSMGASMWKPEWGVFIEPNLSFMFYACGDLPGGCITDGPYMLRLDNLASPDARPPIMFTTETRVVYERGGPWASGKTYDLVTGTGDAPKASFDLRNDPSVPGQIIVTSTSAPSANALDSAWDFGDGHTGAGAFTTHVYDTPGTYTVTLTVRDPDGRTSSATGAAEIAAPALGVGVELVGAAPPLDEDVPVTVRVTVSASGDGVGALDGLAFDAGALVTATPGDAFVQVGDPDPAVPDAPFALAPGESRSWDLTLRSVKRGMYDLQTRVTGRDAAGRAVAASADAPGEIGQPFPVETTILDAAGEPVDELELDADADGAAVPQTLTVKTVVTNDTDAPLTGLEAQPVDLRAADPQRPYEPFPAGVDAPNEAVALGDLAPGASVTTTRTMTVTADGAIVASQLVASGQGVSIGRAPLRVGLTAMLVMKVESAQQLSLRAGDPFTILGTFTNVTNDRTIALTDAVKVVRTGNVLGGGYLARSDGDWLYSDFPPPLIGEIAPGETVGFQVRLSTARPTADDYLTGEAAASAFTRGDVNLALPVRAAVAEDDGTWSALTTLPVSTQSDYPGSIVLKGTSTVAVQVDTTRLSDDTAFQRTVVAGFGLSLGAIETAGNRVTDVFGKTYLFSTDPDFRDRSIAQAMKDASEMEALRLLTEIAVYLPKADGDQLVDDLTVRLTAAYRGFSQAVSGGYHEASPTEDQIRASIDRYLLRLQTAWGSDDPYDLVDAIKPIGNAVGDAATDAVVEEITFQGLVKLATSARYLAPAVKAARDNDTIAKMQATLPSAAQVALDAKAFELSKSKYPALEEAFLTRRALTDVELGVGANLDGAGLAEQTIEKAREWTRNNPNRTMVLIPNEANVAAVRNTGSAVGKIENIKPKSMAELEYLVFGGREEDKNFVVLRDLSGISKAEADTLVDQAIAAGKIAEDDRDVAQQILEKRKKEWALFTNRGAVRKQDGVYVPDIDPATGAIKSDGSGIGNLKAYDEAGRIPNQFRGVDNGVGVTGPQQAPRFGLDYLDDAHRPTTPDKATYVVLRQENPRTGELVKITGDDDGIFIGYLNGLGLRPDELTDAYSSLMDVFNHPFSDTWLAAVEKKLEIFSRYFETIPGTDKKGAPLVMFANGEAYAVKINPWTTRFDGAANRAFIDFVGAPTAVDPLPRLGSYAQVLLNGVRDTVLPANFIRLLLKEYNAAFRGQPVRVTEGGAVVRLTAAGAVESWTLAGGWRADPEAADRYRRGELALAPQSILTTSTLAGATRIDLADAGEVAMTGDWFDPGDRVVIDPGGPNEEVATVSAIGSLVFATGLARPHVPGEIVASLGPASPGGGTGGEDPGTGGGAGGGTGTGTTPDDLLAAPERASAPARGGALATTGADGLGALPIALMLVALGLAVLARRGSRRDDDARPAPTPRRS